MPLNRILEVITVGFPFCAFKIICGLHFELNFFVIYGAVDLVFNAINLILAMAKKPLGDASNTAVGIAAVDDDVKLVVCDPRNRNEFVLCVRVLFETLWKGLQVFSDHLHEVRPHLGCPDDFGCIGITDEDFGKLFMSEFLKHIDHRSGQNSSQDGRWSSSDKMDHFLRFPMILLVMMARSKESRNRRDIEPIVQERKVKDASSVELPPSVLGVGCIDHERQEVCDIFNNIIVSDQHCLRNLVQVVWMTKNAVQGRLWKYSALSRVFPEFVACSCAVEQDGEGRTCYVVVGQLTREQEFPFELTNLADRSEFLAIVERMW